jgi:pyruvate ferredoxin oxidoreductase alpha subunit
VPHRLNHDKPVCVGGLAWPQETLSMRVETEEAFSRFGAVYQEAREAFKGVFGRDVGDHISPFETDDAEVIIIASGTIATTTREVVKKRRAAGEKVGMIKVKTFRPFPEQQILDACAGTKKIGVLDRSYAATVGGIFWHNVKAVAQGVRDDLLIQNYLIGVCGGDVTPDLVDECFDDLLQRTAAESPVWKGIER